MSAVGDTGTPRSRPGRTEPRIAIVRAGIGGLTSAIDSRAGDIRAEVCEQAQRPTEIGAAVAPSANATRALDRLGVLAGVEAQATEWSELVFRGLRDDALPARDARVAGFPDAFGWIHAHRAAEVARRAAERSGSRGLAS